jgi:hypothetical protein
MQEIFAASNDSAHPLQGWFRQSFTPPSPSSEPGHRHMDSENTKQHNNHVQRGDGHEQDDENPKNLAR